LVADLRQDDVRGNAVTAYRQLREGGLQTQPAVAVGLRSEDWQQRFLCALLMVQLEPLHEEEDLCMRILIAHLGDNNIAGDLHLARTAIILHGRRARPWLMEARRQASDEQRQQQTNLLYRQCGLGDGANVYRRTAKSILAYVRLGPQRGKPYGLELMPTLPSLEHQVAGWIQDLGQDGIHLSAYQARSWLRQRDLRQTVQPALHEALRSADTQRRIGAARLLMEFALEQRRQAGVSGTDPLLTSVVLEDLEHRSSHGGRFGSPQEFLEREYLGARQDLLGAMVHGSTALQLRVGVILARCQDPLEESYVPFLLECLADNEISSDAANARRSLIALGPAALPWLDVYLPSDRQSEKLLAWIRAVIRKG